MTIYVRMTDKFMSGWGSAKGMTNVFVVECGNYAQATAIHEAATRRSEMKRIEICLNKPKARDGVLYTHRTFADLSGPWKEFYREQVPA